MRFSVTEGQKTKWKGVMCLATVGEVVLIFEAAEFG